jgi:23S rRNA-/tRNA-specific pseudouridylate synthase
MVVRGGLTCDQLRVLYRDAHFLALDKPSGIATTAPNAGPSLFALAQELDPEAPQLHPLSRLDTQVSGLVVFARTALANAGVLVARQQGHLLRRYLGLVALTVLPSPGEWHWAIGLDRRDPKKRCALPPDALGEGTKQAHTLYAERARSPALLALDLLPQTGRTHQLRVHAAAAGAPLLGDVAYGGSKRLTLDNGRILSAERVMLHCALVCLPHPDPKQRELVLAATPPPDMQQLWRSSGGDPEALAQS